MKKGKTKIIISCLFFVICSLTLYILIEVFTAKINNTQPHVLGFTFHIVVSDSMEPQIDRGDFIIGRGADKQDIKEGDYIIFKSPDPSLKGKTIVHMVDEIYTQNGEIHFITTGIKQGAQPDQYPVKDIIGKYCGKSAFLGKIFLFFSKTENILFFLFIIFITIVIIRQVKNIVEIKKNGKKQ